MLVPMFLPGTIKNYEYIPPSFVTIVYCILSVGVSLATETVVDSKIKFMKV